MTFEHETVLQKEAIEGLQIKPNGTYVDCTVGGAGHSLNIVKQLDKDGLLIAFDQDIEALQAAKSRLEPYIDQVLFIHNNFQNLEIELERHQISNVDGILFDLGVSSPQFDKGERGFSYRFDAKLDMRMNQSKELNAHHIVNTWPYEDLVKIFFKYGEEKFSKQIARKIEQHREVKPIETTFELVDIIKEAIPAPARRTGGHPAKRTFQAIRIAVNDELNAVSESIEQAIKLINVDGRISVITFHSLEDRIVKQLFKEYSTVEEPPKNLPILPSEIKKAPLKLVNRKVILPSEEEVERNKRSRSAKLRIAEKQRELD